MSTSNNNDGALKSNYDVCEINDMLQNIKTENISNAWPIVVRAKIVLLV